MAKVNPTSLQDYNDGQIITADQYEKDREILYVAGNDTHDRLIKTVEGLRSDGVVKFQQAIDTIINVLKLQEGSGITITNPSPGVVNIAVSTTPNTIEGVALKDGTVGATKLDPAILDTIQGIDLGIHRTASVLDHPDQSVTTAKIADSAITTIKIGDAQVTLPKLAQDVQDKIEGMEALYWMGVNV